MGPFITHTASHGTRTLHLGVKYHHSRRTAFHAPPQAVQCCCFGLFSSRKWLMEVDVRRGSVWRGVARCGVMWRGAEWSGVVWLGAV